MSEIVETKFILLKKAKRKLEEIKPFLIFITGSVGKDTTKESISTLLSSRIKVFKSGSENAFPEEIIGNIKSDDKAVVVDVSLTSLVDMLNIFTPDILVITSIEEVPEGFMKSIHESLEKLPSTSHLLLNFDDDFVIKLRNSGKSKKVFYSLVSRSDFFAENIDVSLGGTSFTLNAGFPGVSSGRVKVDTSLLGRHSTYSSLAASAVASLVGMGLSEIKKGLSQVSYNNGRLKLIKGKNKSLLLDDTWNSTPLSALSALETFKLFKGPRKIVVFGDMADSLYKEEEGYRAIGKKAAELNLSLLVVIGKKVRYLADSYSVELISSNSKPNIVRYESLEDAIQTLPSLLNLQENDVILIKGSSEMRLEQLTKVLMENPQDSDKVLVRQY